MMAQRTSIKHRFFLFSAVFFLIIFISSGVAFILLMRQSAAANAGSELAGDVEIERIKLEASVNREIAVALKMADSPLIQQYFMNPTDMELERIAFEEIAGYRRAFLGNTVFWVNDIDRRFFSDDSYVFTLDVSNPDNYWYLMTLNETESYNFNINFNPDLNVINLWINAPVFDSQGRPIGILGTGIDLTYFINSIYQNYSGQAELYFFNTLGEITGARNARLVEDKITLGTHLGRTGQEIINRARGLNPGEIAFFETPGGEAALAEVPALDWYIAAILPISLADALSGTMTVLFVVIMAIIAVIFSICYLFISRMLKPLDTMVQTLDRISGNWDLTQRLEVKRKDESGTLAEFLNLTFEKFGDLLKKIKQEAQSLSGIGNDLVSNMSATAASMNQITANIKSMKGQMINQSASVTETNSTMEQITVNINKLNGHVEKQSGSVAQSSSAIEQMLANIQSVTQTLVKNSENVAELISTSETGREGLSEVASDIQEIARESEGLLEINAVMNNIASQTNLLSMNAAIEAAHAGESGKGFAVVAEEIRKLAENSSKQSKTISTVLKKMKNSIDKISKSTNTVLARFEAIDTSVRVVAEQEENIRNAMEEQGQGSKQILEAISDVNEITQMVKNGTLEMLEGAREIIRESENLEKTTLEITGGINEMASGSDQVNTAVHHINELSGKNQENIITLLNEVSRFKVE